MSGTAGVAGAGHLMQERYGAGYDIVSWDPRAVGSTLPALSCFPDEVSRAKTLVWLQRIPFEANNTLVHLDAEYEAMAAGCDRFSGNILPYMGTMGTVRDLHRLVEVYGYSKKISYQ